MRSRSGRTRNIWWGQGLAHHLRVGFDLEVLEPRLLMAASPAARWGSSAEVSSPAVQTSSWTHSETSWTGPSPGPGGGAWVSGVPVLATQTLAPPTDDTYVIVGETNAFHSTVPTAQPIPTVPYAGVIGALKLGDAVDLYRVVVGPGTLALQLASTLKASPGSSPLQLWVFDSLGHVLASVSSTGGTLGLKLDGEKLGVAVGSPVYIGVAPMEIRGPDSPVPYQLWFLRDSESAATPGEELQPSTLAVGAMAPSSSADSAGGLTAVTALASPAGVTVGLSVPGGGATLVGSAQLPTISAAPSAGVFADGAPTSVLASRTYGDEEAQGGQEITAEAERAVPDDQQTVAIEPGDASPLIARQGPGGFPVLAAASIGDWRGDGDDSSDLKQEQGIGCHGVVSSASPAGLLVSLDSADSLRVRATCTEEMGAGGSDTALAAAAGSASLGLESAFAATVYALSVDRTSLQDLFEARSDPQAEQPRDGKRRNFVRWLLRKFFG